MTENEKPKKDLLYWWLIILTTLSIIIWFIVTVLTIYINTNLFGSPSFYLLNIFYYLPVISIAFPPLLLYIAWFLKRKNKRGLSTLLSVIQTALGLITVIKLFPHLMYWTVECILLTF